jgi:hypothetical protein
MDDIFRQLEGIILNKLYLKIIELLQKHSLHPHTLEIIPV